MNLEMTNTYNIIQMNVFKVYIHEPTIYLWHSLSPFLFINLAQHCTVMHDM